MNFVIRIAGIIILALSLSCGGSKDPLTEDEIEGIEDPVAVTLIFPHNNTECQEGTIINETQSKVVFEWNASKNTDRYELLLENLDLTTSTIHESSVNEMAITLERGTAYRWSVLSKSDLSEKTAESEVWQFYNAGAGIVNHAPFPADAVSPSDNSKVDITSNNIVLKWEAEDIDNDILFYEIYFDTNNPPTATIGAIADKEVMVGVEPDSIYYWYIHTTDSIENISKSDVFSFSTE